jgi:CheY-specific phosphatase CheX
MNHLVKDLKTATFKVMEMMYFLLPDKETMPDHTVYIGISGEPSYLVSFTFANSLARRMAMDLLNVEESDITGDIINQTLKETANIIAGNLLHSFEGSENRNLTMPDTERAAIFGAIDMLEQSSFDISFEGQKVMITIEKVTTQ